MCLAVVFQFSLLVLPRAEFQSGICKIAYFFSWNLLGHPFRHRVPVSPSGFSLLLLPLVFPLALRLWLSLSSKQGENFPFLFSPWSFWLVFSAEGYGHPPHSVQGVRLSPGESCLVLLSSWGRCQVEPGQEAPCCG